MSDNDNKDVATGDLFEGSKGIGLRFKLTASVLIITLTIITGITYVLLNKSRRDIVSLMTRHGLFIMNSFARQIVNSFSDEIINHGKIISAYRLQGMLNEYLKGSDLVELYVVNERGRAIAHSNYNIIGRMYCEADCFEVMTSGRPRWEISRKVKNEVNPSKQKYLPKRLQVAVPLIVEGKTVGAVKGKFSLAEVEDNYAFSRSKTLQIIIIETLVIILFLTSILSIMVIRPIKRLADTARRIAEGELDQQVSIGTSDEIGELAICFNRMTRNLIESRQRLQENMESLEAAYEEISKAQEGLVNTEKEAAIGRLAAGIAHEIGNPLSSILGYTDIMLMDSIDESQAKEYLKLIEKEILRIQGIIQDLLDFSKPREMSMEILDATEVLDKSLRLVQAQKDFQNIEATQHLHKGNYLVMADENRLQQVFINILLNAAQAMQGKGKLDIEVKNIKDDILISFTDSGEGIADDIKDRIFDPFFSTKDVGKGTGLGLTVSKNLVEMMGGTMSFESTVGKGTTFYIRFPAASFE